MPSLSAMHVRVRTAAARALRLTTVRGRRGSIGRTARAACGLVAAGAAARTPLIVATPLVVYTLGRARILSVVLPGTTENPWLAGRIYCECRVLSVGRLP